MRDFLPADVRRREYVMRVIREVYERYGFEPLETPAVENIETLLGKYGEEGNQLIFKILKRGEHEKTGAADLALRYDLTVPLARVVAEYGDKLPKFFKRYQMQPVWRADRPARGRFREFYQCDVDCIGTRSPVVEAELCAAASDALVALGFDNFTIRLNHRQVLSRILEATGIPADRQGDALVAIDKLDKIGTEGVAREFEQHGITEEAGENVLNFFRTVGGLMSDIDNFEKTIGLTFSEVPKATRRAKIVEKVNHELLDLMREFVPKYEVEQAADEVETILAYTAVTSASSRVIIDYSLARGLSYYTGAIMEISVPDLAGSLGGGGRYDNLVGMFSGRDIPACGFSLGLERILVVMSERGMFPPSLVNTAADVLVTIWDEDATSDALALAHELRAAGMRASLYPEAGDKVGKQFKYAATIGVPFVAVAGPDERARGEVALKDMRSGEQRTLSRAALAATLQESLNRKI